MCPLLQHSSILDRIGEDASASTPFKNLISSSLYNIEAMQLHRTVYIAYRAIRVFLVSYINLTMGRDFGQYVAYTYV